METKTENKSAIRLLVALDAGYLFQLCVLLTSISLNNPKRTFELYLLHSSLSERQLHAIAQYAHINRMQLYPQRVEETLFRAAPISARYPKEMYYRLLAGELLPAQIDKILYLDPDTLVINPLDALWEQELSDTLFAAAAHTGKTELSNNVNRLRLKTNHDYYNSGVLLMNLPMCRKSIVPAELFRYVSEHEKELLLPDQDVLNALYGERVKAIDDAIWNYDARNYRNYLLRSGGIRDIRWVMTHTAILHFCGKTKPWKPHYPYRFKALYQHYMQLCQRALADAAIMENEIIRQ